ncbi:hypothetical protein COLO4_29797 [Corchorus olitorius]|uniref:Uncharacterized protein n=1 Tax=Corchorus olitorius TaxID=93759 RepID=A0A1R3HD57_9ROSI|nr:hypothetical protein COLO4_29797 [Corchorus olitorius]
MWAFPQAFLNGCGHGECGARNTSDRPPRPSSTSTSYRRFSGTGLALDPLLLFPSTLIATLITFHQKCGTTADRILLQLGSGTNKGRAEEAEGKEIDGRYGG